VTTHRRSARTPYPAVRVDSPTLLQFVFLSMLLHLLFIVLFGNTTSGGARRGDGEPGSLDVTLRYMSPERGSGFTLAPGARSARNQRFHAGNFTACANTAGRVLAAS